MSDIEYSVITSDVIKSFDCIYTLAIILIVFIASCSSEKFRLHEITRTKLIANSLRVASAHILF